MWSEVNESTDTWPGQATITLWVVCRGSGDSVTRNVLMWCQLSLHALDGCSAANISPSDARRDRRENVCHYGSEFSSAAGLQTLLHKKSPGGLIAAS